MRVIGSAGHVDHGKSTLIAALTGTHPDRLKEEQEREMTIELGFGWLTLPGGQEVGIVDVPGHRDFIGNMLAGVGGIDAALLVIAADEGVMPQTREHLDILDLLQITRGLVVITKTDLVDQDEEWLSLLEVDIRAALAGSSLQDARFVRVSARTGFGLPELLSALDELLSTAPARLDLARARLPIDRVFSMPGFGTVVTGTLGDGCLSLADEVEILPAGIKGRVRGLQTHKKKQQTVQPGSRCAVNISGVGLDEIARGDVLAIPGHYQPTRRIDARFRVIKQLETVIKHATQVKVFAGAAETIATLRILGAESLGPGAEGWVQLELRDPLVLARGDRFIVRRPSPGETLGGGLVLDANPAQRHKRFDAAVLARLQALLAGSPAEVLFQAALAHGALSAHELLLAAHLPPESAQAALDECLASGLLLALNAEPVLIAAPHWAALKHDLLAALAAFHQSYPLRRGMPREELKSRLKLAPRLLNAALKRLDVQDGGAWLALPGHAIRFSSAQQALVDNLLKKFAAAPFAPPAVRECQAEVGEALFAALLELGDLQQVSADVVFRRVDYELMLARLRAALSLSGQLSAAEVRDLFGTSRKYALALLEYLDASGVTVRAGDFRRLRA